MCYLIPKKIGCLILILFTSIFLYGQNDQGAILEKINNSSDPNQKIELFVQLTNLNKYSNTAKSISYAEQANEIAKEIGTPEKQVALRQLLATCYARSGDFKKSIQIHLNTLSNFSILDSIKIKIYNHIGTSLKALDETQHAVEYAEKAIALADSISSPHLAISSYGNLGDIYLNLKLYNKSLQFFLKNEQMALVAKDTVIYAYTKNNLAELYLYRNELDLAMRSANEAIQIANKKKYAFIESEARIHLSNILRTQRNYSQAIIEAKKGLSFLEKANSNHFLLPGKISLVKTKIEQNKLEEALILGLSSLEGVNLEMESTTIIEMNQLISSIYKKKKDYKSALIYSEKAFKIEETGKQNIYPNSLTLIEQMNSSQKIMDDNELLKKQIIENEKQTSQSNTFGLTMTFFSLLLILLLTFFYQNGKTVNLFKNISTSKPEEEFRLEFIRSMAILAILVIIPILINLYIFKLFWGVLVALVSIGTCLLVAFLASQKRVKLIFGLLLLFYGSPIIAPFLIGPLKGLLVTNLVIFFVLFVYKPDPICQVISAAFTITSTILYFYVIGNYTIQSHPYLNYFDLMLALGNLSLIITVLFYYSKNINDYKNRLTKNNKFLNQISDVNPHYIFAKDKNLAYTFVNKSIGDFLGLPKNAIIGKKSEDLCGVNNLIKNKKDFIHLSNKFYISDYEVLNHGKTVENEINKIYNKKGEKIWIKSIRKPLYNNENEIVGILGVMTNITETKLANNKLQKSEKRYRQLFNMSFDGLIIINNLGEILDTNNSTKKLFHSSKEHNFNNKTITEYIPSFVQNIDLKKFYKEEKVYFPPIRIDGKNQSNEIIPLELSLFKIQFNEKIEIACVLKNISAQIILEKKEQELETLNNEIVSQVIFANNKNKLLSEIKTDAKSIVKLVDGKGKQELIKLTRKIGANIEDADNFFSFKLKFEKTHPDFFTKLIDAQPKLTNNDLKLCAYIRLGMNTLDIANLLFIERKSVEMSKYRLKKKLELTADENLNSFLMEF